MDITIIEIITLIIFNIILYSFCIIIAEAYLNSKVSIKKRLLSMLVCSLPFIAMIMHQSFSTLHYVLAIVSICIVLKKILKCSTNMVLISIPIALLVYSFSEMVALLSIDLYDHSKLSILTVATDHFYLVQFIIYDYIYITTNILEKIIKNQRERIAEIIENLELKNITILFSLIAISVAPVLIRFYFNEYKKGAYVIFYCLIQFLTVTFLLFSFIKYIAYYHRIKRELQQAKLYNKTLNELVDSLRLLKHDYNNILQAINGYIATKQYDELEEHMSTLTQDATKISIAEAINPDIINQPAIYGVVGTKYHLAGKKNVNFKLDVAQDIKSIDFDFAKLSRILGILLDNAIEAAEKTEEKQVSLSFKYNRRKNADIIEVKNSVQDGSKIELDTIFNKGVSSKKVKSGLGLWEVKKIISKTKNSQIYADVNDNIFSQTIIIENLCS